MSSASSKLPRIGTTWAPWISACASLPSAIVAVGDDDRAREPGARRVRRGRRRRVAGRRADHDLGALLDRLRDRHRHPAVLERAGRVRALRPSGSTSTRRLVRESAGASSSGVLPSSSVTTGVVSVTGRCSRYASMSPGQRTLDATPRRRRRAAPSRRGGRTSTSRSAWTVRAQGGLARQVRDEDRGGRRRRCPAAASTGSTRRARRTPPRSRRARRAGRRRRASR